MRIQLPGFINYFISSIPFVGSTAGLGNIFQKHIALPSKNGQINPSVPLQQKNVIYGIGLLVATTVVCTLIYLYRTSNKTSSQNSSDKAPSQISNMSPIVRLLIAQIESENNLDEEGIYRISASSEKIASLMTGFEQNPQGNFNLKSLNARALAGFLKALLRKLEPKLLQPQYELLKEAANEVDEEKKIKLLQKALKSIPKESFKFLEMLVTHLKNIAAHSNKNKMNALNLSTAIGPSIVENTELTQEALRQQVKLNSLIQLLIEKPESFF